MAPAAELRFDLTPTTEVADLTGPATGISRLVARPPTFTTATVIDTADRRLLNWGVELFRIAETGQWVLLAPGWAPVAPETRSPQAEDDLPGEMAAVLVPFRRGGILGPQFAVAVERRRFTLIGEDGGEVGDLVDDRVAAADFDNVETRFRTVTVRGVADQSVRAAIGDAFAAAGAVGGGVELSLAGRLGLLRPTRLRLTGRSPVEDFVRANLADRWRRLLLLDLSARASDDDGELRAGVQALRGDLAGLGPVLDEGWSAQAVQVVETALADNRPLHRSERWLRILDLLDQATTAPPLGGVAGRLTGPVLAQELEAVGQILIDHCRTLEPYSEDPRWARAHQVAGRAVALSSLARDVFGKPAKRLRRSLRPILNALAETVRPDPATLSHDLHGLTSTEVFEAGRAYERAMMSVDYARAAFVRNWPESFATLRRAMIRPRAPHTPLMVPTPDLPKQAR